MTAGRIEAFDDAVVRSLPATDERPQVVYRVAGDAYLMVEYGDFVLDLALRLRVHSLASAIERMALPGIVEAVPGVRSLLIHYDCLDLRLLELVEILCAVEDGLPPAEDMVVESRLVRLPLTCRDKWTAGAVAKYMESIRADAPYVPDNVEFIARCNGLAGPSDVEEYVLATQHIVMGLGDVYLGAPCAVPLDPRRRLIVPKYNPTRTWTPEGAVGIGGAYLCIYPMESPGGYQLFGRTLPIWNTAQSAPDFQEAPWLLRFFDRIQFFAVDEDELEVLRHDMRQGDYTVEIEGGRFTMAEYQAFLDDVRDEAAVFRQKQHAAAMDATIGY